jgi:hypothetical protein
MTRSGYLLDLVVFFDGGTAVSEGAVQLGAVYQAMYSTMARRAAALVGQGRRSISSPLIEAKNDSERALSQH